MQELDDTYSPNVTYSYDEIQGSCISSYGLVAHCHDWFRMWWSPPSCYLLWELCNLVYTAVPSHIYFLCQDSLWSVILSISVYLIRLRLFENPADKKQVEMWNGWFLEYLSLHSGPKLENKDQLSYEIRVKIEEILNILRPHHLLRKIFYSNHNNIAGAWKTLLDHGFWKCLRKRSPTLL